MQLLLLVLALLFNLQLICIEGSHFDRCHKDKIDVREGSPATLECRAKQPNEKMRYLWLYQDSQHSSGNYLQSSDSFNFDSDGVDGDLTIRSVDRNQNGVGLSCHWGKGTQKVSCKKAKLRVFWLNNITVHRTEPAGELKESDNVLLKCTIDTNLNPSMIKWTLNGRSICDRASTETEKSNGHCIDFGSITMNAHQLRINGFDKTLHSGVYHCYAQTDLGHLLTRYPHYLHLLGEGNFKPSVIYANGDEDVELIGDSQAESSSFMQLYAFGNWATKDKTALLSDAPQVRIIGNKLRFSQGSWRQYSTELKLPGTSASDRGHFFYVRSLSSDGRQMPYLYEIVQAAAGQMDGMKNFEPALTMTEDNTIVVGIGKNFTQHVYLQQYYPQMQWRPDPTIEWRDPNNQLITHDPSQPIHIQRNGDLAFNNVQEKMGGMYKVRVWNPVGSQSFQLNLLPSQAPILSQTKLTENAKQGTYFRLPCGRPKPQFTRFPATMFYWFNASSRQPNHLIVGHQIPSTDDLVMLDEITGDLVFKELQLRHKGNYRCRAVTKTWYHNSFRSSKAAVTAVISLIVTEKLKVCPKIVQDRILLNAKTQNIIDCSYDYKRPVKFEWRWRQNNQRKFKKVIPNVNGNELVRNNSQLKLHYVSEQDEGVYQIQVTDEHTRDTESREIQVFVGERIKFSLSPTDVTASVGDTVLLQCQAKGRPRPTIGWRLFHDNELFELPQRQEARPSLLTSGKWPAFMKDTIVLNNGSLLIRRASEKHFGLYRCVAKTDYQTVQSPAAHLMSSNSLFASGSRTSMTKTIVIVVSCAVGYLSLIVCLSVCCTVQMQRRRQKRGGGDLLNQQQQPEQLQHLQLQQQQQYHLNPRQQLHRMQSPTGSPNGSNWTPAFSKFPDAAAASCYESAGRSIPAEYKSLLSNSRDYTPPPARHTSDMLELQSGHQAFDDRSLQSCSAVSSSFQSGYGRLRTNTPANSTIESTLERVFHMGQTERGLIEYRNGILGRGLFGSVRVGSIHDSLIVVKELAVDDPVKQSEFAEQIKMFSKCDHDYVTRLMGVCIDATGPALMILEYCENGNLYELLQSMSRQGGQTLTESCQTRICLQVAQALEHFHSLGFVHGDLGCRNILVTQEYNVKLTNLGPCLDRFSGQYVCNFGNVLMPIRWLPPEALVHNQFGIKTDVWSFGVLVAELFGMGCLPFASLSDSDVLMLAQQQLQPPHQQQQQQQLISFQPELPPTVPHELQLLTAKCWSIVPDGRPTAAQIVAHLGHLVRDQSDV